MSLADLSSSIRRVLDVNYPIKNLPEFLATIDSFVQRQKEAPEQDVLDQLRDDLGTMYRDVDHTASANVEKFVSILCAFLPISRPINVITHWWDLVLRASLRDPRLSTKALRQAKELTLHGLISDSAKVTEFRKRIIEVYLRDAYDESSGQDAIEHATMSAREREIQQFWKQNLEDILEHFCMKRPEEFLSIINTFFTSRKWRLRLAILLGVIVRSSDFPVKEFANHPILESLLLSLIVDNSSTLLEIEITALVVLLPQFAVHSPDTLKRILSCCYVILAKIICWKSRLTEPFERDDEHSDTSSQTYILETNAVIAQMPQLQPKFEWQQLDTMSEPKSKPPSPLRLFRCLYALYPCNTLDFLRDPINYISQKDLESPFTDDWTEVLDEDQIRTRSRALVRLNVLHSELLMNTAESELAACDRWAQWDVPRIALVAKMVDVNNAALSWRHVPEDLYNPDITQSTLENIAATSSTSLGAGNPPPEKSGLKEFQSTDFSYPGHPSVSVQDILATHHALMSGVEIDIVNPAPEWPQLLFPSTITSRNVAESPTISPSSAKASDEDIPPHVGEAISKLQRENLLLRNELNFELWLKRETIKRVGQLYQDRILVKGAEVERQGLHNKLREYKGQVQRLQDTLAKEQAGATAAKSQHTDYSNRLQAKLKAEREEKRRWAEEKSELQKHYDDAKAMLDAQRARLDDAMARVFELETQIKEDGPKVQRLRDYERKIEQFTKTQQLWDDDVRRLKEQQAYLDELRSRYRKKLLIIESYEKANQELEETIISLKNRVSVLESQENRAVLHRPQPSSSSSQTIFQMMEGLRAQVSALTLERDGLRSKSDALEDRVEDLKGTVDILRSQVGGAHEPTDS